MSRYFYLLFFNLTIKTAAVVAESAWTSMGNTQQILGWHTTYRLHPLHTHTKRKFKGTSPSPISPNQPTPATGHSFEYYLPIWWLKLWKERPWPGSLRRTSCLGLPVLMIPLYCLPSLIFLFKASSGPDARLLSSAWPFCLYLFKLFFFFQPPEENRLSLSCRVQDTKVCNFLPGILRMWHYVSYLIIRIHIWMHGDQLSP